MSDVDGGIGLVSGTTVMAPAKSVEVHRGLVVSHTLFHDRCGVRSCGNCGAEIVHDEIQETCLECNVPLMFAAVTHNFLMLEEGAALFRGSHLVFVGEGTRERGIEVPILPEKP